MRSGKLRIEIDECANTVYDTGARDGFATNCDRPSSLRVENTAATCVTVDPLGSLVSDLDTSARLADFGNHEQWHKQRDFTNCRWPCSGRTGLCDLLATDDYRFP